MVSVQMWDNLYDCSMWTKQIWNKIYSCKLLYMYVLVQPKPPLQHATPRKGMEKGKEGWRKTNKRIDIKSKTRVKKISFTV